MIENLLVRKNYSVKIKVTIKSIISFGLIALAILLPQLVHLFLGSKGGVLLLPMYLPVLICACILGVKYGLIVAIATPIFSYFITLSFNNPMPALPRLPFMIVELSMFAIISGLFSKKIVKNAYYSFLAVILAQVIGRATFLLSILIFDSISPLSFELILSQIKTGLLGVALQALIVPFTIIILSKLLKKDEKN